MKYIILLVLCTTTASCGPTGAKGATGIAGPVGKPGLAGNVGSTGTSCTTITVAAGDKVLPNGGAVIQCGSSSTIVSNGSTGQPGVDATPITVVQLCSQYETVYPTSFPEFAFCLNNSLFGVYWTGSQAFLAEIVPGAYISTSPQGCNFTISANCKVVN